MSSDTVQVQQDQNANTCWVQTRRHNWNTSNIQLNLPLREENRLSGGSYGTVYKAKGIIKRNGTIEVWTPNPFQRWEADRTGHQSRNEGYTRYGSRDWSTFKREIDVPQDRDILGGIVHLYGSFTCYDSGTSSGSQFSVTPLCPAQAGSSFIAILSISNECFYIRYSSKVSPKVAMYLRSQVLCLFVGAE